MLTLLLLIACPRPEPLDSDDTDQLDTDVVDTDVIDTDVDTDVIDTDLPQYGLDERPANPTCTAPPRPASAIGVAMERRYPALTFQGPVHAIQAPGAPDRWYVVENHGVIRSFDDDPAVSTSEIVVDLRDRVAFGWEMGLFALAFHPDFAKNGEAFVTYTTREPGPLVWRLSRLRSTDGLTLDPATEEVVLEADKWSEHHNGGMVAFGPDGFLYASIGDGGCCLDPHDLAQNTDSLLGKVLRIDVDGGDPYAIPSDNPFAEGGAPEVYALGFRNPWRFSFDTATGRLWLADVGDGSREEIDRVDLGGNYGWDALEGTLCLSTPEACEDPTFLAPVHEYDHSGAPASISGGYVWHGASIPELEGAYLYGDFITGVVEALAEDPISGEWGATRIAEGTGLAIAGFGQGLDGEVVAIDYNGGLYGLKRTADAEEDLFPRQLSETGCIDEVDPRQPASGLVPYAVNAPFWSGHADKERWLAIPDGTTIGLTAGGDLDLPVGSVLLKHFELDGERVETRLFTRHDDGGWAGYTYAWNDAGTDAEWVPSGRTATVGEDTWVWPTRGECLACHTEAAGRSLGPEVAQLNGDLTYPTGRTANQLATLAEVGLLDADGIDPTTLPALPDPYGEEPVEDRARAWLHTNCSACHRPGSTGVGLDLRWTTPLADTGVCAPPTRGDLGIDDARIVAAGEPDHSVLLRRIRSGGLERMPPLGVTSVDEAGTELVASWVKSLSSCP